MEEDPQNAICTGLSSCSALTPPHRGHAHCQQKIHGRKFLTKCFFPSPCKLFNTDTLLLGTCNNLIVDVSNVDYKHDVVVKVVPCGSKVSAYMIEYAGYTAHRHHFEKKTDSHKRLVA